VASCRFSHGAVQASLAFGAGKPPQPAFLDIQGQRYANACLRIQAANLKKTLFAGQVPDAMQAWQLIDLILCVPINHANRLAVKNSIKDRVGQMIELTGDEPEQKLAVASEALAGQMMAGRQAWNANIDIDIDARTIALEYYPNEACIKTVTLEYIGATWMVSKFAEACD
jgi:hypothetical protein